MGDTGAVHTGTLQLASTSVEANTVEEAVSLALAGSIQVEFAGESIANEFAVGFEEPFRIVAEGSTVTVEFEDLAGMPDISDWDYNDRSWVIEATEDCGCGSGGTSNPAPEAPIEEEPIEDEPEGLAVSIEALTEAREGDEPGLFRLTRSGDLTVSLSVLLAIGGTAGAGTDYDTLPTSVTFAAGEYAVDLPVEAFADTDDDDGETVVATIAAPPGYEIFGSPSATVPIRQLPTVTIEKVADTYEGSANDPGQLLVRRHGSTKLSSST